MKASLFLTFVLCVTTAVLAQDTVTFLIDNFGNGRGNEVRIDLPDEDQFNFDYELGDPYSASEPIISNSAVFDFASTCDGLVGCSRDMQIEVLKGVAGGEFKSKILSSQTVEFQGTWSIESPKASISLITNEYDGFDSDVDYDYFQDDVDRTGLGGVDITANGRSEFLEFICSADLETEFLVDMYDVFGNECRYQVTITPSGVDYTTSEITYRVDINDAIPNACVKTQIDYIGVTLQNIDGADVNVRRIQFFGVPPPSPSPSPTRTRTPSRAPTDSPSRSLTRTPTSSPSRTRTPTPSESSLCSVICNCPVFSCHLIYNIDDDDDLFFM